MEKNICNGCGEIIEGNPDIVEDEMYCSDCYDTIFYNCVKCGKDYEREEIGAVDEGNIYCPSCARKLKLKTI